MGYNCGAPWGRHLVVLTTRCKRPPLGGHLPRANSTRIVARQQKYKKTLTMTGIEHRPDAMKPLMANRRPTMVTTAAGDPALSAWSSIRGRSVPITTRSDITRAVPGPAPSCAAKKRFPGGVLQGQRGAYCARLGLKQRTPIEQETLVSAPAVSKSTPPALSSADDQSIRKSVCSRLTENLAWASHRRRFYPDFLDMTNLHMLKSKG